MEKSPMPLPLPPIASFSERRKTLGINDLPDDILISILNRLEIKEAARTSILSKKWKYFWACVPDLKLDDNSLLPCDRKLSIEWKFYKWVLALYNILTTRQAFIDTFYISFSFFDQYNWYFDEFFLILSRHRIQKLDVVNQGVDYRGPFYCLPHHLYSFSSLTELSVSFCELILPPSFMGFCNLRILGLQDVVIRDADFELLVAASPKLENLILSECKGLENIRIHAPQLLSFAIQMWMSVRISLVDAPRLKRAGLLYSADDYHHNEDEAAKFVDALSSFSHIPSLFIERSPYTFKYSSMKKLLYTLSAGHQLVHLKELTVSFNMDDANSIFLLMFLLRSCPNLQELVIESCEFEENDDEDEMEEEEYTLDLQKNQNPPWCFIYHLKTVQIYSVSLTSVHLLEFVKYILFNAHHLKRMNLNYNLNPGDEVPDDIINELLLFKKTSEHVVLDIKPCRIADIDILEDLFGGLSMLLLD